MFFLSFGLGLSEETGKGKLTECPKVFSELDLQSLKCEAICPQGWNLVKAIDPQTGAYACQDPNNPEHICHYINPVCSKSANPAVEFAKALEELAKEKIFWQNLGSVSTDVSNNGVDFPQWWIRALTLDPDVYSSLQAYWGKFNDQKSEMATTIKFTREFISKATKIVAFGAFFLSALLGSLFLGKFYYSKLEEAKRIGHNPQSYALAELKKPLLGFATMLFLFNLPIPHTSKNQSGEETKVYYPAVVSIAREILLWGNSLANELSHAINQMTIAYTLDQVFKALHWKIKLTELQKNYWFEEYTRLSDFVIECKQAYGLSITDTFQNHINELDELTPYPPYTKQTAPDPWTCYMDEGYMNRARKNWYYYTKLYNYYYNLEAKILQETGFEDAVIKKIVVLEKQLGWLSTPIVAPLMKLKAVELLQEKVKENVEKDLYEQLEQVRDEYIRIGPGAKEPKVPPWYQKAENLNRGFSEDEGLLGDIAVFLAKVGVFTSLPPGNFIDNFLNSILYKKDEAGNTVVRNGLMKIFSYLEDAVFLFTGGFGKITLSALPPALFVIKKIIAYYLAIAVLAILPLVAITLATLFRFFIYSYRIVVMVASSPFVIFKSLLNQNERAIVEFSFKVVDLALTPSILIVFVGISFLAIAMSQVLLFELPDVFLQSFYQFYTENMAFYNPTKWILFFFASTLSALFFYIAKVGAILVVSYIIFFAPDLVKEWVGSLFPEERRAQIISPLKERVLSKFFPF